MTNHTLRRVVFGVAAALFFLGLSGLFAYFGMEATRDQSRQAPGGLYFALSASLFLLATFIGALAILATRGSYPAALNSGPFLRACLVVGAICVWGAAFLGWLDAIVKADLFALVSNICLLGMISAIWLRNRLRSNPPMLAIANSGLALILSAMLLAPMAYDAPRFTEQRWVVVAVVGCGIYFLISSLVALVRNIHRARQTAQPQR